MDRLKREWEETQSPEEVLLRARNAAWAKIQRPAASRRPLGLAAVATAVVIVVVGILIWSRQAARIERVSAPARQIVPRPAVAENQAAVPHVETPPLPKSKPVKKHIASAPAGVSTEEYERIVLNFTLPESGARMIWVIDSRFNFDGGDK